MGTPPKTGGGYPFLRVILDQIDDSELIAVLKAPPAKNGRTGRPSYPARALWRAKLSKDLLNIPYTVELVERLHGSQEFRDVCGFGDDVPSESTFSRFFKRLEQHQAVLSDCLYRLTEALREHIPDLGESVAIDSTSIEAFANPHRRVVIDPDAKWGVRHSSRSSSKDGTEWFFGYKMHTLADADHGVPLGFIITSGNVNDGQVFAPVIDKAMDDLPWLEPKYVIADRGYDYKKCYQATVDWGAVPIIHIRDTKAKGGSPVYDPVAGAPTCLGKKPMEYVRTDPETGRHLFRCAKGGCHLKPKSNGAWQYCDDEVWEDPVENLRVLGVVARASEEWSYHYAKRQAVERLFGCLKRSRNLETHFSRNISRMILHATLSLLAYQATALARVKAEGIMELRQMRVGVSATVGLRMAA
jgi:IS5 family transposase